MLSPLRACAGLALLVAAGTTAVGACSNSSGSLRPARTLPPIDTRQLAAPEVIPFDTLAALDEASWTLPEFVNPGPAPTRPPTRRTTTTVKRVPRQTTTTVKRAIARRTTTTVKRVVTRRTTTTVKRVVTRRTTTTVKRPGRTTAAPRPARTTTAPPPGTTTAPPSATTSTVEATPTTLPPLEPVGTATGIGVTRFGDAAQDVQEQLQATFGEATEIDSREFPDSTEDGAHTDGTLVFAFPAMSKVCYRNGLCAYFGGDTVNPETMAFVGWEQTTDRGVTAVNGWTIGTTQAEMTAVTFILGPCPNQARSTPRGGPTFELTSSSGNFYESDPQAPLDPAPDPTTVKVTRMFAGKIARPAAPAC